MESVELTESSVLSTLNLSSSDNMNHPPSIHEQTDNTSLGGDETGAPRHASHEDDHTDHERGDTSRGVGKLVPYMKPLKQL